MNFKLVSVAVLNGKKIIIFQEVFFIKCTPLWFQQQIAATTLKCVQSRGTRKEELSLFLIYNVW